MTMSVWEQRTSQLRRHRQMSSREILFSSPSEERDGPPASSHGHQGRPLSLHRKALENTPSGSLKHLKDPSTSPVKNQAPASTMAVDVSLDPPVSADVPEAQESALDPMSALLPEGSPAAPEPHAEGKKLAVDQSYSAAGDRRSPRLNGDRQHRAVKKFRPPDNLETLTPERGGHDGRKGRRARSHGSSPGNGGHLGSRSASRERKRNPGKAEEVNAGAEATREEEAHKPEESR